MMTLHDTIELTKKVALFGVLGIIGIFVIIMLFRFGGFLKEQFFPTPPPAPLNAFGKLPSLTFPEGKPTSDYSYEIDTLSGQLPNLGDRMNVYKIVEPLPEFYDLTRAKTKAKNINLTASPIPVGENLYQWTETADPQRKLVMNVVTKSFMLTSNYATYQPVLAAERMPDTTEAIAATAGFLDSLNAFPDTINEASTSAKPFAIQNGSLVETTSLQNAQVYRIDFYQSEVESLPIYYPDYPRSLIYALVASGPSRPLIVEAHFSDQLISGESSDYPIKTADQAFADLQQGKGHVASYGGKNNTIKIKDVTLGYYLGETPQEYLMPVIVFSGENGFLAYVSAISDQALK